MEHLEVSESQQRTRRDTNMMLRGRGTPRAAWPGEKEGRKEEKEDEGAKPRKERNVRLEERTPKWGNGETRVSLSVTLFHMVEPLFKRPITL